MMASRIYSEDHELFRTEIRKFLESEAMPRHEEWEKQGQVSRDLWTKAGEAGFLCPMTGEAYGGVGADFKFSAVIAEEVFRLGLTGIGFGLHSDIVAPYIEHYGSETLKQKYLPKMVSGEMIGAIGMTEPDAGSDLQGIKTMAIKDSDHYFLSGQKTFITNGQLCDLVLVAAKTDPKLGAKGMSLFIVESNMAGFSKGQNLPKVGMKAQDTSELFFDKVKVPLENLVGEEGRGFQYLMQELPQERLMVAVSAVAAAEAALQWTLSFVKERKAFGKRIMDFQNTRFKLAELQGDIHAGRAFLDRCIEAHTEKKLDVPTAASLKAWTTELQCKVTDECLQLHGGYGYMSEYPISRAWVDARVQKIYAGTNEIMKEIVARSLDT